MSTTASLTDAQRAEALRLIDRMSRDVPIDTTLMELQLVVERVTFSGLNQREVQSDAATMAEIDLFFRDEVSDGMVEFVRWFAEREMLDALSGDQGTVLLDQAITTYRDVQEVRFVTAIPLEKAHKARVMERLRTVYPEPARILFGTSSLISAGFVIYAGKQVIDKSLRTYVATTLPRTAQMQDVVGEEVQAHG